MTYIIKHINQIQNKNSPWIYDNLYSPLIFQNHTQRLQDQNTITCLRIKKYMTYAPSSSKLLEMYAKTKKFNQNDIIKNLSYLFSTVKNRYMQFETRSPKIIQWRYYQFWASKNFGGVSFVRLGLENNNI